MPQLPAGRLTRGQIVQLAVNKAGNLTLGQAPAYVAQTWLNAILDDLYQMREWPFLYTQTTLQLLSDTVTLPANFLKPQGDNALEIITADGVATQSFVTYLDRERFENARQFNTQGGTPSGWTVDDAAGVFYLTPSPVGHAFTAILRYKVQPAAIPVDATGDATIPTFPYSLYLVQRLYAMCLAYEGDQRAEAVEAMCQKQLVDLAQSAQHFRSQAPIIPLDPDVFTDPFSGD